MKTKITFKIPVIWQYWYHIIYKNFNKLPWKDRIDKKIYHIMDFTKQRYQNVVTWFFYIYYVNNNHDFS